MKKWGGGGKKAGGGGKKAGGKKAGDKKSTTISNEWKSYINVSSNSKWYYW